MEAASGRCEYRKVCLFLGGVVKSTPPICFGVMSSFQHYLVSAGVFLLLAGTASIDAAQSGFVQGHFKIISPKEVELAVETTSSATADNYAEYPWIILGRAG